MRLPISPPGLVVLRCADCRGDREESICRNRGGSSGRAMFWNCGECGAAAARGWDGAGKIGGGGVDETPVLRRITVGFETLW